MKTLYKIYRYESKSEIIPRKDNSDHSADDIEGAVIQNNSKADCFLYDNVILETESEAEAKAKFASLEPCTYRSDSYPFYRGLVGACAKHQEMIGVVAYGMQELEVELDEDGEPTGNEDIIDETWKFAPLDSDGKPAIDQLLDMLREDWEFRCAVIDDFIAECDSDHTWISEDDIPEEIEDENAETYADVLTPELVAVIARNTGKLTVARQCDEFANLCEQVNEVNA